MSELQVGGAAEEPAVVWAAGAGAASGSEVAGCGASLGPAESQTGGGHYRGRPAGAALHLSSTLTEKRHSHKLLFASVTVISVSLFHSHRHSWIYLDCFKYFYSFVVRLLILLCQRG